MITILERKIKSSGIVAEVTSWLDEAVIGLDLCPFAKISRARNEIRFSVSTARSDEVLLTDLADECLYLRCQPSIETTLLIIPGYLQAFDDFNQFLASADGLLEKMHWTGVFQIASFHPDYQFANTEFEDRENWTNRSPYPVLHILREESLTHAIDSYPGVDEIPEKNIARMRQLDERRFESIFSKGKSKLDVSS